MNAAENLIQKEIIIKSMKRNGHRLTKQRLTLINIILENNCSSCKEIYYKASKVNRKIGVATTYRMIRLLEEIGAITRDNLFKLEYRSEHDEDKHCNIKLEDGSIHQMLLRDFDIALNAGMITCGFFSGHHVVSVELNGVSIEWEKE
ncbi:transcriptional repressor [Anaerotignum sp.]|uniref:transcriptional repressor n=1 Tax=Anaerotignum sp. TaxID=2039241 RepID=UPI00289DF68C|nr:transcriptional repressor [Anaerotignum sp.]